MTALTFVLFLVFVIAIGNIHTQNDGTCDFYNRTVSGEFTVPGRCLLYRCFPGIGVRTIGCGINVPPEGCVLQHPTTPEYPECCQTTTVCPGQESITQLQNAQPFQVTSSTSEPQHFQAISEPQPFQAAPQPQSRSYYY